MSRSLRKGINYFSLDVEMFSDRKVKRLVRSCGAAAVSVLLRLWCGAYDENGYYLNADGDLYFDIAGEIGVTEEYAGEVIMKSLEAGLFDRGLYERFGILTSRRMQSNYADATKRRDNAEIKKEYLLIPSDMPVIADSGLHSTDNCTQNENNCVHDADKCMHDACESTQSKVKQSKEEESTPKQGALKARSSSGEGVLSFGDNVSMTKDEYAQLCSEFGECGAKRMIEILGNYKASKGKYYANDYRAILSWVVKRWREEQPERTALERPIVNYDYLAIDPFAEEGNEGAYARAGPRAPA